MIVQFDNRLISSFLLFLDNSILKQGQAHTNFTGRFYPVNSSLQGYYAYSCPYRQLVNDISVTGATVISGLYLNGSLINIGTSGYSKFNHQQGTAYFTSQLPANSTLSGSFSIKDFNIKLTDEPEHKLLFQTKYTTNSNNLSGLPLDTETSPIIYIRPKLTENLPFAFGGMDDSSLELRAIIISDNLFQKVAICNILKNLNLTPFSLINSIPLDHLGNYTGQAYNYDSLDFGTGYYPIIVESKVADIPLAGQYQNMPRNVAVADIKISVIMRHD